MGSMWNGKPWEKESEKRAKAIAKKMRQPEGLWELFLMQANQEMLAELKKQKKD